MQNYPCYLEQKWWEEQRCATNRLGCGTTTTFKVADTHHYIKTMLFSGS